MQWGSNEEAAQSLQLQKGKHLSFYGARSIGASQVPPMVCVSR